MLMMLFTVVPSAVTTLSSALGAEAGVLVFVLAAVPPVPEVAPVVVVVAPPDEAVLVTGTVAAGAVWLLAIAAGSE